jgi:hypothetical protein
MTFGGSNHSSSKQLSGTDPKGSNYQDAPTFTGKEDYYKLYWRMYLQNENLLADIENVARQNYKDLKKIFNLEDYYEHHLIP